VRQGEHDSSFILHPFPLPWSGWETSALLAYAGLVGLTLVVIVIPVAILRLATRRRFRSVRILAVLPLAVALPLTAYVLTIRSPRPQIGTPTTWSGVFGFIVASTGGLPILAYLFVTVSIVVRRRWQRLAGWLALTAISGLVVGLIWVRSDMQRMPSIEHYSWSGWYQPVVPGAYYVGAIVVIVWAVRGVFRFVRRFFRRPVTMTLLPPGAPCREV